ncbi:MAG TPA: ribosomal-processing cysteine protease Prp [Thermoanaerobacterales bacterium]|nr:ribosomal-processing cysteine protease Prp [Thermoanaerobacterales bacterium]
MINVKVESHPLGGYKSIEISGHAEYAEYGKDIVCAGVSVLAETAVLGLKHNVGIKPLINKEQGCFILKLPDNMTAEEYKKTAMILKTIILGLEDISKSYPLNIHMEIIEEV